MAISFRSFNRKRAHLFYTYNSFILGNTLVLSVLEYSYDISTDKEKITKIHIRFGKPIWVQNGDNLVEKLADYNEVISTIRWDLLTEKGIYKRSETSLQEYENYLQEQYRNLKLGKLDIDKERRNIYGAQEEFHQFFRLMM